MEPSLSAYPPQKKTTSPSITGVRSCESEAKTQGLGVANDHTISLGRRQPHKRASARIAIETYLLFKSVFFNCPVCPVSRVGLDSRAGEGLPARASGRGPRLGFGLHEIALL
jgi:hypothetical protein